MALTIDTVCAYTDDNGCTGPSVERHSPHAAEPDLDRPVSWEDGDERRDGHICIDCGHVVAEYPYHTDPRLDQDDDWACSAPHGHDAAGFLTITRAMWPLWPDGPVPVDFWADPDGLGCWSCEAPATRPDGLCDPCDTLETAHDSAFRSGAFDCWSCGELSGRPDGLCDECGAIDPTEVPDIRSPAWVGNTKPLEAIFVAPPGTRTVR